MNKKVKKYLLKYSLEFLVIVMGISVSFWLSNYHSAYSAVAEYPNLTIPMGYKESGEPVSLTFIGKSNEEGKLLLLGYTFEQLSNHRKMPEIFK
ncbi:amidase family protein [Flavobacteriaceae bacterium]|nr:amidase family protein [Flavobacteriaceae bacterium]MDB2427415.1 amidase family protein [Flavobacteriaceae bacterium]MDC0331323.1 amidase family protein [Flavobacteriaceae bacterium]